MTVRTITITGEESDWTVSDGDRSADRLCWDEMLGTVAELTHPRIGQARYRMDTPADAWWRQQMWDLRSAINVEADGVALPIAMLVV